MTGRQIQQAQGAKDRALLLGGGNRTRELESSGLAGVGVGGGVGRRDMGW